MRKNSVKNRRINDEVQRALAGIVREVKDPRISPLTSVTGTEVAPDLKTCRVYVSVYGDDKAGEKTMEGLRSAAGFYPQRIGQKGQSSQHSAAHVRTGRFNCLRRCHVTPH